ncbi:unnamed protein product, partial [Symbiodinium pilosum]
APADAMEALLGALVVVGGLSMAAKLLRKLPWFGSQDGHGFQVPLGAPESELQWIGSAMVRFFCTAWLLSVHPELGVDGLSDLRTQLLSMPWSCPVHLPQGLRLGELA